MAAPRPSVYNVASGAGVYAGIAPPPAPAPALTFTAGASSGTVGGASIAGPTISAPGGNAASVSWALTSTPAGQTATPASGTLAPGASVTPTLNAVSAAIYAISVANNSGGTVNGAASPGSAGNVQWYAPTPPPPPPPPPPPAPAPSTGTPQPFTLTSASSGALPFAVGYAMSQGHVPAGQSLSFAGATAKLTVLSTWPDGSARHGIIAGTYTSAGSAVTVTPTVATVTAGTALTGAAVQTAMGANTAVFDAGAFGSATFSGADFATPFVTHAATDTFIEAIYRKQIGSDAHLVAWLSLRVWSSGQVEALPWVENGFIRVAGPTSKSATYSFTLGGTSRFSAAIDLPARTRTPLVSGALLSHWLVTDPAVVVKHDAAYMMATRLVPTYGATVSPSAVAVTGLSSTFTPLQLGNFTTPMGNAGYQPAIGLLPEWDALYLTCTASSVWSALQRNAYSAGRWGIYYRDENTHRPLRFSQFPNLSANNSTTSDYPATATGTSAPAWDVPHHPSMGYMAYLVTGRWFHMETVQFAATFNYLANVDGGPYANRNGAQGLFKSQAGANTTRGAAWSLRTLAQAATITPDSDTLLRAEFVASLEANVNYYHGRFVATANNPFGIVDPYGDAYGSPSDGKVTEAPWQQNFFTAATGYALAMNPPISGAVKTKLQQFFAWKAKSIVGMLGGTAATSYLYRDAGAYTYVVAEVDTPDFDTGAGPWPASWGRIYELTNGVVNPGTTGDLRGGNYPAAGSYWGNLQPAIAYAVEHGVTGASEGYLRMVQAGNWSALETAFNTDCVWSVVPQVPAHIRNAAEGEWTAISANTMASVGYDYTGWSVPGYVYPLQKIMNAWSGGTYDHGSHRLFINGGGHNDYDGNEMYAFNLRTGLWSRLDNPSPYDEAVLSVPGWTGLYPDNGPQPIHTYEILNVNPLTGKVYRLGVSGSYYLSKVQEFDPSTATQQTLGANKSWWAYKATVTWPDNSGSASAWMSDESKFLLCYKDGGTFINFRRYDPAADTVSAEIPAIPGAFTNGDLATAYSATRQLAMTLKGNNTVVLLNTATNTMTLQAVTGATLPGGGCGLDYDPVRDVFWAYADVSADRRKVISINPSTWVATELSPAGATIGATDGDYRGIYGRFAYCADYDVLLAVNSVTGSVYIYKPTGWSL